MEMEKKATFCHPWGITLDANEDIVVADFNNNAVRKICAKTGEVSTIYQGSEITHICGVAVTKDGDIIATDQSVDTIRRIDVKTRKIVETIAGGVRGFGDGLGSAAQFYGPSSVVVDDFDNIYVSDQHNKRIRKIANTPEREVTTIAGTGTEGFKDGPALEARFHRPANIIIDKRDGSIIVSDLLGQRIRKITNVVPLVITNSYHFSDDVNHKFTPVEVFITGNKFFCHKEMLSVRCTSMFFDVQYHM